MIGFFMICASLPRRLSSLNFGTKDIDFETLRVFYRCEDISKKRGFAFYDECLKRSKSLVIDGQSFKLPNKLKKELLYDKVEILSKGQNSFRYRPSKIYDLAMAVARSRNSEGLIKKLLSDSSLSHEVFCRRVDEIVRTEKVALQEREISSQSYHLKNLQHDTL